MLSERPIASPSRHTGTARPTSKRGGLFLRQRDYILLPHASFRTSCARRLLGHCERSESVDLTWGTPSGIARYYLTYRLASGGAWTEIARPGGTVGTYDVSGLECGTAYRFAVKAHGDGQTYSREWGAYSYDNATTSGCPVPSPPPPTRHPYRLIPDTHCYTAYAHTTARHLQQARFESKAVDLLVTSRP